MQNLEQKQGIIIKGIGGFYYVETADGVYECRARGHFRQEDITPVAGDSVVITLHKEGGQEASVEEVLPRKNVLVRPPIANVDQLLVVSSVKAPNANLYLIDKIIAAAELQGIEPVVVFTKTDLKACKEMEQLYREAGFSTFCVNQYEDANLEELRELLRGKITAFAGNTGVGKSTLINKLDADFALPTGEISKKLGRGRHTTRHVELYHTCGGYAADTPGFSSLAVEQCATGDKEELFACFREFAPYFGGCRFNSCTHINEPGCALIEAAAQGKVAASRYASYKAMYEEIKDVKQWEKRKTKHV